MRAWSAANKCRREPDAAGAVLALPAGWLRWIWRHAPGGGIVGYSGHERETGMNQLCPCASRMAPPFYNGGHSVLTFGGGLVDFLVVCILSIRRTGSPAQIQALKSVLKRIPFRVIHGARPPNRLLITVIGFLP